MKSTESVTLVIPGRHCAATLGLCLEAVAPLLTDGQLSEIFFVDDGSTDDSAAIAADHGVRVIRESGRGRGAARNAGWRAAQTPLIWFIDADCVAEWDTLSWLRLSLDDLSVAGVGGSYGNMRPDSMLACLIHEEIRERHRSMPRFVDFLATFNVLYRRTVLESVGGFDERFRRGQDAELAWRILEKGYRLVFEDRSRVAHHHPVSWRRYLRDQRDQGYWRVWLHLRHRGHSTGDTYSRTLDHLQPPLAMLFAASCPLVVVPALRWAPPVLLGGLVLSALPMTVRLARRTRSGWYAMFGVLSLIRSFSRGWGMLRGMISVLLNAGRLPPVDSPQESTESSAPPPISGL